MSSSETGFQASVRDSERPRGIRESVADIRETFREMRGRTLDESLERATDWVRRNPGKAILIAAAAGLLVGGLLSRRRR